MKKLCGKKNLIKNYLKLKVMDEPSIHLDTKSFIEA